jgi:hypothetical protein
MWSLKAGLCTTKEPTLRDLYVTLAVLPEVRVVESSLSQKGKYKILSGSTSFNHNNLFLLDVNIISNLCNFPQLLWPNSVYSRRKIWGKMVCIQCYLLWQVLTQIVQWKGLHLLPWSHLHVLVSYFHFSTQITSTPWPPNQVRTHVSNISHCSHFFPRILVL